MKFVALFLLCSEELQRRNTISIIWYPWIDATCAIILQPPCSKATWGCQSVSKENWRENEMFISPQKTRCAATSVQGAQGSVPGGEALWHGEGWWEQGWGQGARGEIPSSQVPASPHSPDPTVRTIPIPDSGKGFPHLSRKQSHSEVVGEEIHVAGEVISFKLQGFSSWGFQLASAQYFTVFQENTLECLTTIYLSELGNWEWKGRWFSFEQKGTAAVQAVARICLHRITAKAVSAELSQTKAR